VGGFVAQERKAHYIRANGRETGRTALIQERATGDQEDAAPVAPDPRHVVEGARVDQGLTPTQHDRGNARTRRSASRTSSSGDSSGLPWPRTPVTLQKVQFSTHLRVRWCPRARGPGAAAGAPRHVERELEHAQKFGPGPGMPGVKQRLGLRMTIPDQTHSVSSPSWDQGV